MTVLKSARWNNHRMCSEDLFDKCENIKLTPSFPPGPIYQNVNIPMILLSGALLRNRHPAEVLGEATQAMLFGSIVHIWRHSWSVQAVWALREYKSAHADGEMQDKLTWNASLEGCRINSQAREGQRDRETERQR